MIAFWILATVLALVASLFVILPLVAARRSAASTRSEANLAIYREQSSDLDADLAAGNLTAEQHEQARRELEARLLEDVGAADSGPAVVRRERAAAVTASIALPLLVFGLYLAIGNPSALEAGQYSQRDPAHALDAGQVQAMADRLATRMAQSPGDAEGWNLLARTYLVLGRYGEAAEAYRSASELRPRDAALLADYADALAMAQGRRLAGAPEQLLARALEADPRNLKALALAGTASYEKQDYEGAAAYWERILPLVPPGSENEQAVKANIAEVRARLAGAEAAQGRRKETR